MYIYIYITPTHRGGDHQYLYLYELIHIYRFLYPPSHRGSSPALDLQSHTPNWGGWGETGRAASYIYIYTYIYTHYYIWDLT